MSAYRQGDILFKSVWWRKGDWNSTGVITRNRFGKKKSDIIVAAGEATGHHHRVSDSHVRRLRRNDGADVLLVSKHGTTVTHEEHASLLLPPGAYEIVRQREYAPNPIQERRQIERDWAYVRD